MSDDVRLPPNSLETEQALIGALLIRSDMLPQVASILDAGDFYRKHHSAIWEAMVELADKGAPVDILTVSRQLNDADQRDYIIGLSCETYNPSSAIHYAQEIRKSSRARQLQKTLGALHEKLYSGDVDEVLTEAEQIMRRLAKPPADESVDAGDIIADVLEDLTWRCSHPGVLFGIPSGYRELDSITGGFDPGSLIVLGGRTGTGKTTIAVDMVRNILTHYNLDAAYFSLEMAKQEIMAKLVLNQAQVSAEAARWGHLDDADWQKLTLAQKDFSTSGKFHLFDRDCLTVPSIRRKLLALPELPSIAIIDHLHIMHGVSGTTDRIRELGEITMDLKNLAKEIGIPIIALCQLSRAILARNKEDKRPNMSDLRASGEIEENCDQIIFIHRPGLYNEEADQSDVELIVAKMRQAAGDRRIATLAAVPSYGRFRSRDALGPMDFILKKSTYTESSMNDTVVAQVNAQDTTPDIFTMYETSINNGVSV